MKTFYRKVSVKQAMLMVPMLAGIASVSPSAHAQSSVPVCASANSDPDGDGFGWENNATCTVGASSNTAMSSQFNGGQANTSGFPTCSSSSFDPDGDGFGFENNQTCFVVSGGNTSNAPSALSGPAHPACSSRSADPDGDGFGFENNQTCLVTGASSNSVNSAPPVAAAVPGPVNPVCSSRSADPDGDGFGFENNQTCIVTGASSNSANSLPPPPVAAAVPGSINGRPVCLADSSDVNNSGFGFENGRTCVVQPGVTATRSNPLFNQRVCDAWFEIPYGNFRLQNNVWNASAVFSNNWSQCITLSGNASQPVASWDYNWLGRFDGQELAVKSYPQVYYGRKTRFNTSGSVAETGLPAPLNSVPRFTIDFAYSETGNAERNVAFESFFHYSPEAEDNNKQFEMMVWVGKPDLRTPGPLVTTARIDGRDWDVHVNPQLGWGYVAFVAQTPFNSGRLDWSAFIDWTRNSGPGFGVPSIVNNTWMGAIELGTETFWGAGTFSLDRLNITRR